MQRPPIVSNMKVCRYLILAMLFLPMVALAAPPSFSTSDIQTITYTSLSTITEGITTATITFLAFNTSTYRTTEATMTIVKYTTTTTVFVEVRYGVTKAPHVVYVTTTTTLPQILTQIERYFIETKTAERTLTTYGPATLEKGVEE
ncbi:MAG: hypothetical protein V1857_00390, partial [archaeon]